ncbi:MAG: hypothetical protein ABI873_06420 [Marmoricola sp.]
MLSVNAEPVRATGAGAGRDVRQVYLMVGKPAESQPCAITREVAAGGRR